MEVVKHEVCKQTRQKVRVLFRVYIFIYYIYICLEVLELTKFQAMK